MTGILLNLLGGRVLQPDPYFEYTTLLLPGNGTNGKTNNVFEDSSTANSGTGWPITRNPLTGPNAPTQGTFSPFSQTGWGNYFSGSGQYLSVADSADFDVASGNFTIEAFVFRGTTGVRTFIYGQGDGSNNANTSVTCEVTATNKLTSYYCVGSAATTVTATNDFPSNSWVHVAIVRNGGNLTQYINGTKDGENTSFGSQTINNSSIIFGIGSLGTYAGLWWNGYISNFRFVKGTAVYTANFTPPTSPLTAISGTSLLTCQSNRFIDTNTQVAAKTITANGSPTVVAFSPFNPTASWSAATYGGSGYFDGNGDYLTVPAQTALSFAGDFTIETWIYITSNPTANYGLLEARASAGTLAAWVWDLFNSSGTKLDFIYGAARLTSASTVPINQWVHLVVSRVGSTIRQFINGTVDANTATTSAAINAARTNIYIGNLLDASTALHGYISGIRVVNGSGVTSVTVPTAPLTAITNTSLLLAFTNAGIYDATSKNLLETVDGAQVSTAVSNPFGASTGVMYFDGTGDYLKTLDKEFYDFGTGDFTLEGWVYHTTSADINRTYIGHGSGGFWFYRRVTTGQLELELGGSALITSSSAVAANVWTHVAASRSGTSLKLFINGTQEASTTNSTSVAGTTAVFVGMNTDGTSNPFIGYMSNMRVTKGYARYTSSFTVPSSDFPTF